MTVCVSPRFIIDLLNQLQKQRAANNVAITPAIRARLRAYTLQFTFVVSPTCFGPSRPSSAGFHSITQNVFIDIIGFASSYFSSVHVMAGQIKTEPTHSASLTA
jgi:hypothetical protein